MALGHPLFFFRFPVAKVRRGAFATVFIFIGRELIFADAIEFEFVRRVRPDETAVIIDRSYPARSDRFANCGMRNFETPGEFAN